MKNTILTLLIFLMTTNVFAQEPRAYFSTSKKALVVDGKTAETSWLGGVYKVPGQFSDNQESHDLYMKSVTNGKWGVALFWGGFAGMIGAIAEDDDRIFLASVTSYLAGVLLMNKSATSLNKAMNIYNGVPSDQAWNKDLRGGRGSYSSTYGINLRFEF